MQSFITNLLRLIVATGIIVCWGKCHGVDTHWCSFLDGWYWRVPSPDHMSITAFIGGGARIFAEVVGFVAALVGTIWTLYPKDSRVEDNSSLANVISKTFFGGK